MLEAGRIQGWYLADRAVPVRELVRVYGRCRWTLNLLSGSSTGMPMGHPGGSHRSR